MLRSIAAKRALSFLAIVCCLLVVFRWYKLGPQLEHRRPPKEFLKRVTSERVRDLKVSPEHATEIGDVTSVHDETRNDTTNRQTPLTVAGISKIQLEKSTVRHSEKQASLQHWPPDPSVRTTVSECVPGRNKAAEQEWMNKDQTLDKHTSNKNIQRAQYIKSMMKHAWDNYVQYAWGRNELAPEVQRSNDGIFPGTRIGLTIVDSLDTLWLMGMFDEVREGKEWLVKNLPTRLNTSVSVSVFEFNIRFVGGLLSMYALTNECDYKYLAQLCADKLLPAFNTTTGIPLRTVNLKHGFSAEDYDGNFGTAVLSEIGTLHLEFVYLSYITGDPKYAKFVSSIRDSLTKAQVNGLYSNSILIDTAKFEEKGLVVSLGGGGDSFYEYLFKSYLQSNKQDVKAKDVYFNAMKAIVDKGLLQKSFSGLRYFGMLAGGVVDNRMEHLTCFIGGLIGLSAEDSANVTATLRLAEDLASTCHESYIRSDSKLGPEAFSFDLKYDAKSKPGDDTAYRLRPETVETWFTLYRITHNHTYQDWAWDFAQALEKYSRKEHGYSGLTDVYLTYMHLERNEDGAKIDVYTTDGVQQSFFLAETLKYLYLIYKDESFLSLKDWVFNTEAHPLPVLK